MEYSDTPATGTVILRMIHEMEQTAAAQTHYLDEIWINPTTQKGAVGRLVIVLMVSGLQSVNVTILLHVMLVQRTQHSFQKEN
jgi:hypothetical protein